MAKLTISGATSMDNEEQPITFSFGANATGAWSSNNNNKALKTDNNDSFSWANSTKNKNNTNVFANYDLEQERIESEKIVKMIQTYLGRTEEKKQVETQDDTQFAKLSALSTGEDKDRQ
eukprot:180182_1